MKKIFIPVFAIVLGFGTNAFSVDLLNDNFDSYADQAAFQAAWPATVGAGGTLISTNAVSLPNSVRFDLTPAQRNDRGFTESGNPSQANEISFSFDFYDSNAASPPYRQVSSLIDGAGSSSGQLVSLGLNNNHTTLSDGGNFYMARILGAAGGTNTVSTFFKLNDNPLLLRTTGWHNLEVRITDVDFKFYVDGSLAETVANGITLRSYDSVRLGSGLSSTELAIFDNVLVSVNPVPEPSTVALGLIGGVGLLAWRFNRRRSSK